MRDDPALAEMAPDALSLAQPSPEVLERDELVVEVRRLRLRLDALREQRDERIQQLLETEKLLLAVLRGEEVTLPGGAPLPVNVWRKRAVNAEAQLAALLATRTMRALRVPRQVYGRLRAARSATTDRPV